MRALVCLTPPWRQKAGGRAVFCLKPFLEPVNFQWTVLCCDRQVAKEPNRGASRVIPDLLQVQEPAGCAPLCVWRPRSGRRVGWPLKKKKWKIASHFQRTVLRCDRQVAQELNRGASRVIPDLLQVKQPTRRRQIPVFACLTPPWRPKARFRCLKPFNFRDGQCFVVTVKWPRN